MLASNVRSSVPTSNSKLQRCLCISLGQHTWVLWLQFCKKRPVWVLIQLLYKACGYFGQLVGSVLAVDHNHQRVWNFLFRWSVSNFQSQFLFQLPIQTACASSKRQVVQNILVLIHFAITTLYKTETPLL